MKGERINLGGMFRCCVLAIENIGTPAVEGDVAMCPHCYSRIAFTDGAWNWVGDAADTKEKSD